MLISIQNEREWARFCRVVLDAPDLPQRPGFASNNARVANRASVDATVAHAFAALTRTEAAQRLDAAGTAYGFVNGLSDLARHPALRRVNVKTPNGSAAIVAPPALRDGAAPALGPVPAIGAHDAAIRAEFAA